jgi:hypothetical protein
MGCGCNKKKALTAGGQRRVAVYQLLRSDGTPVSEHGTYPEARAAASRYPGAKIRSTTKFVQP